MNHNARAKADSRFVNGLRQKTKILAITLKLRERLLIRLEGLVHQLYKRWFRHYRPAWQQDLTKLLNYEPGSLGHAIGLFLVHHQLTLIPRFEDHDVFHVLLGYDTSVRAESEMQFCLLGSGKRSLYVLGTCAIAWLAFSEYRVYFRSAFSRGQQLRRFHHWYFEYLLGEQIEEIRNFIGIK